MLLPNPGAARVRGGRDVPLGSPREHSGIRVETECGGSNALVLASAACLTPADRVPKMLTLPEVAEALRCSVRSLYSSGWARAAWSREGREQMARES